MYCPSCTSNYVGFSFPTPYTSDASAKCRKCGHSWGSFDEKRTNYIPMLSYLMKETFDKTT